MCSNLYDLIETSSHPNCCRAYSAHSRNERVWRRTRRRNAYAYRTFPPISYDPNLSCTAPAMNAHAYAYSYHVHAYVKTYFKHEYSNDCVTMRLHNMRSHYRYFASVWQHKKSRFDVGVEYRSRGHYSGPVWMLDRELCAVAFTI